MTDSDPTRQASQAAQDEAAQVAGKAQDAARDVTDTARQEASQVAGEAADQIKSLASSAQDEFFSQASTQQGRLAEQSRTVTDDIHRISRGERPESDLVNGFVSMVAQRAEEFTSQLENKEPADLLKDVRRFAARRPGAFLAIAAGIGLVAGRLTRGLTDSDSTDDSTDTAAGTDTTPRSPGQARLPDTPHHDAPPTTPAPPAVPHGDVAGLMPENTPGDTLATGGNKHHLDPDPAAPVDGYLGGGSAIDPEERR